MSMDLANHSQLIQKFIEILRSESAALTSNNIDDVVALTPQKLECADQLEALTTPDLIEALAALRSKIQRNEAPQNDPYFELLELIQEANQLNQINGVMIEQSLTQIRLAISRLDALSPARQLYGKDGLGQSGSAGRSFGAV